jgi:hypothetical protein
MYMYMYMYMIYIIYIIYMHYVQCALYIHYVHVHVHFNNLQLPTTTHLICSTVAASAFFDCSVIIAFVCGE